jgi:hypothetical protein
MNVERAVWENRAGTEKQVTNPIRPWNDHNPACAYAIKTQFGSSGQYYHFVGFNIILRYFF